MKKIVAKLNDKYYWLNHETGLIVEYSESEIVGLFSDSEAVLIPDAEMNTEVLFTFLRSWGGSYSKQNLWKP